MGILDPSNDGGFTSQTQSESWYQAQVPVSSNEGGFTGQTFISNQMTSGDPWGSSGYGQGYDDWGTGSWGGQSPGASAYTTQRPTDFAQLVDTGTRGTYAQQMSPSGGPAGPSGLWIVDVTGFNKYPSMSIPLYGYAREELTPSMAGYLTVEEMYPDGHVETFGMGYVQPYRVYKMWFYADVPGTHMVRYGVNGYYSNVIRFYVQSPAPRSTGWGISRGTTHVITGGGTTVSGGGSTTVRTSGGSISISTSVG